jgi:hypothetical protein
VPSTILSTVFLNAITLRPSFRVKTKFHTHTEQLTKL